MVGTAENSVVEEPSTLMDLDTGEPTDAIVEDTGPSVAESARTTLKPRRFGREPVFIDLTTEDRGSGEEAMQTDIENADDNDSVEVKYSGGITPSSARALAEASKERGNQFYKNKEYLKAIDEYSRSVELCDFDHMYLGNRCACYLMIGNYKSALIDARKSVTIEPTFAKGYQRFLKSALALGDISTCEYVIQLVANLPENVQVDIKAERSLVDTLQKIKSELKSNIMRKDYRTALFNADQAIKISSGDLVLHVTRADLLLKLNRFQEAHDLVIDTLRKEANIVEGWLVAAKCTYQLDICEKSLSCLKKGLCYEPDCVELKTFYRKVKQLTDLRSSGRTQFTASKFAEAKLHYSAAMALINESDDLKNDSIKAKLCYNIALISQKMGVDDEALEMCNKALELNLEYTKALQMRAGVLSRKGMFEESVRDYEALSRLDPTNRDWKRLAQDMTLQAKKAKRKDYYKILGIEKSATDLQVRQAYKKRALIHHPDRHSSAPEQIQKENEKLFKELSEAYETLSNEKKRHRYDLGEDLHDSAPGYETFDASQLFNVYFGGMGGGGSSRHHAGYHHFRQPGGFHQPR